ncbi:MAG: hypothetical protein ACJ72Z_03170 [Pyrinomonadaceae bacterium]
MALFGKSFGRRSIALFWCGVTVVITGVLIYLELIPVLYVLATLSLVVLLLIVAFADLENVGRDVIDES